MTTGHSNLRGCKNLCLTLLHPDREAPIKTRKRTFSEANSSNATATRRSPCSAAAPQSLRKNGYFQALIPNSTADTLAVAVKAFQAQLEVLSKQPPQSRHAGFTQLARKQRLEFCAGDHALGQLGLLQGLAITVQALQKLPP